MRFQPKYFVPIATVLSALMIAPATRAAVIDFEDVANPLLNPGEQLTNTQPNANFTQISQGFNFGWQELVASPTLTFTHGHLSRAGGAEGAVDWIASNDPLAADPEAASTTYVVTDDSFNADNFLEISPVDGAPFSMQSFEVAEAFGPDRSSRTVSVFGFFDILGTVADLSMLDVMLLGEDFNSTPTATVYTGFQLVTLGPEWTGLARVVFDGSGGLNPGFDDYYAIDNITVNAPIVTDPDDPDEAIDVPEPSSLAIFGFATIALGWAARRGIG